MTYAISCRQNTFGQIQSKIVKFLNLKDSEPIQGISDGLGTKTGPGIQIKEDYSYRIEYTFDPLRTALSPLPLNNSHIYHKKCMLLYINIHEEKCVTAIAIYINVRIGGPFRLCFESSFKTSLIPCFLCFDLIEIS